MQLNFYSLSGAKSLLILASSLLLAACSEPSFKIKGEIEGADNQSVLLEKSDFMGRWVIVDSTRTSSSGSFSISRPAPAAPEIFRLDIDNRYIYLPIDSIETLTVTTTLKDFGTDFSVTGSEKAEALTRFEKEVHALPDNISADSLTAFKRNIFTKYMRDAQGSIVSYYILTKVKDNKPLFDPETDDYKYFAAVATGFKELRPYDPHTALLENTSVNAIKKRNAERGNRLQIEAEEVTILDIDLPDENGKNRKLSEFVGNGKPTVVMFTLLTHPDAPAANIELSKLYNRYGGNVNFYQVSLDPDQYAWRDAARNLPWITVFDADGEYSKAARMYNVGNIPAYYIYDRKGDLAARAVNIDDLSKQLASY
ncbi:MAG: DUF4369 domain-containing protein [Muribaculaceae bacterium]|nr:DUF4369 domain-containing protein [Muribaculaceae bacterium]